MSHYPLNKGINKPVEFKGLVGSRYIFMLLGGLGGVFLGYIVLHVAGVSSYLTLPLAIGSAFFWITRVFSLSAKYGEHGAMKLQAKGRQPKRIVNRTPRLFKDLKR
jgi:predicted lipid-binding transport protein (Tim44 family)